MELLVQKQRDVLIDEYNKTDYCIIIIHDFTIYKTLALF